MTACFDMRLQLVSAFIALSYRIETASIVQPQLAQNLVDMITKCNC